MPKPKHPYAQAFRNQMVELVRSSRKPSELSKKFGGHTTSILSWVRRAGTEYRRSGPDQKDDRQYPNGSRPCQKSCGAVAKTQPLACAGRLYL